MAAMKEGPRRVHILGGPGSGKTFLAMQLCAAADLAHVDLDELFWDNKATDYNTRRSPADRDRLLQKTVSQECWVIEGVYHSWLQPSFERADIVVILAPSVWLRDWRIVRRFIGRKLKSAAPRHRRETLKGLWGLIKWNHAYEGDNLARAKECLKPFAHKIIECSDVSTALRRLTQVA